MRAVVQRVSEASVTVQGSEAAVRESAAIDEPRVTGAIGLGFCVLLGVGVKDTEADAAWMADKIASLRIFEDEQGKMNRSLLDVRGAVLAVSQFTLYGDARKGSRPGFIDAARPEVAQPLYARFCALVRSRGIEVQEGVFRATMQVRIVNEGPVTILLDSSRTF
ncbi:MAG TPA: D-aminoacyl-tRNA deacylase [Myxococcales bacterium]